VPEPPGLPDDHAPADQEPALEPVPRPRRRGTALLEVIACSGLPTQLFLIGALQLAGMSPLDEGRFSPVFVATLSMLDAALVISFCLLFLVAHGESPSHVLLGQRPLGREALVGAALVPVVFITIVLLLLLIQQLAPWLHNVPRNPLEDMLQTPQDALLFAVVVIVAGGLREEVQRGFILHRFEQSLGGGALGLVVWSVLFGLGHIDQGYDASIATGMLGAIWGFVYLRRRSIVAPVVSHSGFNLLEVGRFLVVGPSA
jgi:membrane protease YdiL (CAAX protease family)